MSKEYRNNVYCPSSELSGSIIQIRKQKESGILNQILFLIRHFKRTNRCRIKFIEKLTRKILGNLLGKIHGNY